MTKNKKQPKFKITDEVHCPRTLYGENFGVVKEIVRMYKEYENDQFIENGMIRLENIIPDISLPYKFDGETLEITFPPNEKMYLKGKVVVSKFWGYSYVVETPKMSCIFSERQLKLKK